MPYADPERQREEVKVWQQSHPEKLKAYRKKMFMRNSIAKHHFPKPRSIHMYNIYWAHTPWTHSDLSTAISNCASTRESTGLQVKTSGH